MVGVGVAVLGMIITSVAVGVGVESTAAAGGDSEVKFLAAIPKVMSKITNTAVPPTHNPVREVRPRPDPALDFLAFIL